MNHKKFCGEYRTVFEKIYSCESTNVFQYNLYFSKKTFNITEMKGNITFLLPLDDTLTLDINGASWGSIGGWKPNSIVYITKNTCSNSKNLLGNVWYSLIKAFNGHITSCPLPAGTYMTNGIDLKELENHNAPKVFFMENINNQSSTLDLNIESWDSIGDWKPNPIVYITKNACLKLENLIQTFQVKFLQNTLKLRKCAIFISTVKKFNTKFFISLSLNSYREDSSLFGFIYNLYN
ncbi:hypothetical protein AGLY_012323 [Aphis glycines]|uniref:Uncharacterized protein n=1 Tax=Aphis glycines TaxID=307491 RepID=A0A6G0TBW1_APHGL|nr:hypothetical protein AGLY_012323 [Aphis glycines]